MQSSRYARPSAIHANRGVVNKFDGPSAYLGPHGYTGNSVFFSKTVGVTSMQTTALPRSAVDNRVQLNSTAVAKRTGSRSSINTRQNMLKQMHHKQRMKQFAKAKLSEMLDLEAQLMFEKSKRSPTDREYKLQDIRFTDKGSINFTKQEKTSATNSSIHRSAQSPFSRKKGRTLSTAAGGDFSSIGNKDDYLY
jgi:hypothetical protein